MLSCSPNFPRAFILRHTHAKHGLILYWYMHVCLPLALSSARCRQIVFRYFYCLYLPPIIHPKFRQLVLLTSAIFLLQIATERSMSQPTCTCEHYFSNVWSIFMFTNDNLLNLLKIFLIKMQLATIKEVDPYKRKFRANRKKSVSHRRFFWKGEPSTKVMWKIMG